MEDEERTDEYAPEEGGNRKLRAIERSGLRGAQGRPKRRQSSAVVGTRQKPDDGVSSLNRPKRRQGTGKKAIIFFSLILIIVLFLLTTVFATARLNLTLSSVEVSVDGVFNAIREPAQSKDVSYRRLGPFDVVRETSITNITRERQNTRAEGTAVLYNVNPSGERLDLLNRTQLQSESGTIYRLIGKQVIPGGKTVNGTFVPGSKEVRITADDFGDDFNLPNKGVRLSIPKLSKYKQFADTYAVTSSKVVGGFSGERFIPDADEEVKAREQIRRDIEDELRDALAQSVANNSLSERVVFEDGVFIEFESLENVQSGGAVIIREKGVLYAISFRETELAALLVKYAPSSIQSVLPSRVESKNLSMSIEKKDAFEIVSSTEFAFRLTGSAHLFWGVDTALLSGDIAGKDRTEVADILTNEYPQVIQYDPPSLFPAWRKTFPGNKQKIQIDVEHAPYT